ncbi:hypothetical protein [Aquimarina mytili]|uniref:Uncharacterized protein n=1 Tax=Aquimarina mytili TaxID=874423 RepID=A0A937D6K7_9FLAO|nr:hypothetical protein [Aquimarina mytili]MBL0682225.1 hypothetical protein [Aquimarina mytili]
MKKRKRKSNKPSLEKWTVVKLTKIDAIKGGLNRVDGGMSGGKTCPVTG